MARNVLAGAPRLLHRGCVSDPDRDVGSLRFKAITVTDRQGGDVRVDGRHPCRSAVAFAVEQLSNEGAGPPLVVRGTETLDLGVNRSSMEYTTRVARSALEQLRKIGHQLA